MKARGMCKAAESRDLSLQTIVVAPEAAEIKDLECVIIERWVCDIKL